MPIRTTTRRKKSSTTARPARALSREPDSAALHRRLLNLTSGESLADVGRRTGFHPENVRRYLGGLSAPPVEFIGRVAVAYGCSVDWLVLGRGKAARRD